jgi:hypothetical protein
LVNNVVWAAAEFYLQILRMQRKTGTRLPVIPKRRLPGTAIYSSRLPQKMRALEKPTNLLTFGGTEIPNFVTTHISPTDLAVVGKASDGG